MMEQQNLTLAIPTWQILHIIAASQYFVYLNLAELPETHQHFTSNMSTNYRQFILALNRDYPELMAQAYTTFDHIVIGGEPLDFVTMKLLPIDTPALEEEYQKNLIQIHKGNATYAAPTSSRSPH